MEMIPISCPRCGGSIHVPAGRRTCFCTYCGSQLYADDGSTIVEYRVIDEARIREAEISSQLELRKLEIAEAKRKTRNRILGLITIVGAAIIAGAAVVYNFANQSPWALLVGVLGVFLVFIALMIWYESSDGYKEQAKRNLEMLETMTSIFRRR